MGNYFCGRWEKTEKATLFVSAGFQGFNQAKRLTPCRIIHVPHKRVCAGPCWIMRQILQLTIQRLGYCR